MKAIVCTRYGPPEVLQLREVAKPEPKSDEVLIRIHATAVTASDCIVRGFMLPWWQPMGFMMGLMVGFKAPRQPILGMILAGQVEEAGQSVRRFRKGDQVYGTTVRSGSQIRFGTYAEYICLPEDSVIAEKPADLSAEAAAALPYGGGLAIYFLRKGGVQSGQNVLVYGASGAIGTMAVQLAKAFGAQVTGVCSTNNMDLVTSLGADRVIDYTQEGSADQLERYDLVMDAVGKSKSSALKVRCQGALTPNGRFISVDDGRPVNDVNDLALFNELVAADKVMAVIDRVYPLEQMAEAHRYVDMGHKRGNVVITVN
jgi:NADPH:quinone reductase-like Zn-dependent oxidoreductase